MATPPTDSPSERYDLLAELGTGRVGTTYQARDRRTAAEVTIKVLHAHLASSAAYIAHLRRTVAAAASLRSEHLAAVREVTEYGGRPCLVADFIAGESLAARLQHDGALTLADALEITRAVVAGLGVLHEQ